jgi:hypothetical protein
LGNADGEQNQAGVVARVVPSTKVTSIGRLGKVFLASLADRKNSSLMKRI